eukprot:1072634-Pyramimonas_sp.AAC.1
MRIFAAGAFAVESSPRSRAARWRRPVLPRHVGHGAWQPSAVVRRFAPEVSHGVCRGTSWPR